MTMQITRQDAAPPAEDVGAIVERVLMAGDLARLTPDDRVKYYESTCRSLGMNPLTRPFEYINLSGKLQLYARKDATDQLRRIYQISVRITARERVADCWAVTAQASTPNGRTDESVGAVSVGNAKGDALANMLMKAETKAKRRVTLSICGLGMLDECELETVPGAVVPPPSVGHGAAEEPVVDERVQIMDGILTSLDAACGKDKVAKSNAVKAAFGIATFAELKKLPLEAMRAGAAKLHENLTAVAAE